jgi:hypothetical protein
MHEIPDEVYYCKWCDHVLREDLIRKQDLAERACKTPLGHLQFGQSSIRGLKQRIEAHNATENIANLEFMTLVGELDTIGDICESLEMALKDERYVDSVRKALHDLDNVYLQLLQLFHRGLKELWWSKTWFATRDVENLLNHPHISRREAVVALLAKKLGLEPHSLGVKRWDKTNFLFMKVDAKEDLVTSTVQMPFRLGQHDPTHYRFTAVSVPYLAPLRDWSDEDGSDASLDSFLKSLNRE